MKSNSKAVYSWQLAVGSLKSLAGLLCILMSMSLMSFAQAPQDLYKNANALYKANQFEQAAADYEKIISQGYKTPEVYYNLGNCYYKLNSPGKAILNYERAHQLAPDDEDINQNLKIANLKTIDKITTVPQLGIVTAWNNFMASHSSRGWAMLGVVFLWLTLGAFAVYTFVGIKKLMPALGVLCFIFSIAFISLAFRQSDKEQNPDSGILMVESATVKSAPDTNGNDLFAIHEGIKFTILDQVSGWNKIKLADGKVGWLEHGSFQKI
jgi:tetratricopeptide (TPR) repeat protein